MSVSMSDSLPACSGKFVLQPLNRAALPQGPAVEHSLCLAVRQAVRQAVKQTVGPHYAAEGGIAAAKQSSLAAGTGNHLKDVKCVAVRPAVRHHGRQLSDSLPVFCGRSYCSCETKQLCRSDQKSLNEGRYVRLAVRHHERLSDKLSDIMTDDLPL